MSLRITTLDQVVISVENVAISVHWYQRTLGMEREDFSPGSGENPHTTLKLGRQRINLRPADPSPGEWIGPDHRATGSQSLCFLTAVHAEGVVQHLRECGVRVVAGPVKRVGPSGTLFSVYCRDPDGNLIEVSSKARRGPARAATRS
jgi:catechol 2,3-dioxygenase-like lactoylglutathione lyase family enzyme